MNQTAWLGAAGVDDVPELLWEDGERGFYKIWRNGTDGTRRPYLAVLPTAAHPTQGILDRLAHEYALRDQLDGAWAVRPVELVRERGATALVFEFHDGEPLDRRIAQPMEVGGFLRTAVAVAAAVGRLHERGLVHKDIKPANILVDPAGDRVRLMGFGVASRLTRERQAPEAPERIAGTLSHMAPEQTGRMNRSIDSRADLYSLGVTLYQALTGRLPFIATTPLEWVHCHIARRPVAPNERMEHIPLQLSAIVMKLLAKTPEDRYQTAAGVERDLSRCLADWDTRCAIDDFPLAAHDHPDRLLIPERLYGRESEIDALLTAFENVATSGTPALVLVSGSTGIGKSSLVDELHKALVPRRGLFASGKFDQLKRDVPYATLAQAFQGLMGQLLATPEAELGKWRAWLRNALTPNGVLLFDLIPELELIIGEQPSVPEVPPADAKARFQSALRRLISVFARAEHPLALFLDDLQWLDGATLELLENIFIEHESQHLLVVGAYRDNEVNLAHPLKRKVSAIRESGAVVQDVVLGPLEHEGLTEWLSDALRCQPERALALAQLVHQKTAGNPYFANQFLQELVADKLIAVVPNEDAWRWDLESIRAKDYTDNVIDLMVGKLSRLPISTQNALKTLACLGNQADTSTLAIVHEAAEEQVHADLWQALGVELIVRSDDAYRFAHDRVQEATYSLIPETQRAAAHVRIGRLLVAHTPAEDREEAIFEIVNQLNRGGDLIVSRDEKERLAELNLIAGRRAKASTAYASGLNYLVTGAALLVDDGWKRRPDLMFALELQRAECEFLTGDHAVAEARLVKLSSRAANPVDRATVACLHCDVFTTLGRSDRALGICLDYLRHLGIEWSAHPTEEEARREYERMWALLGRREIEELIDLPVMSDPEAEATMEVLTKAITPALFTDPNLLSLVLWRMVNLSLEFGNTEASCQAYAHIGGMSAGPRFGNYEAGFRFGRLGYNLVERRGFTRFQARTNLAYAVGVVSWSGHLRAARDLIRQTFDAANTAGDLTYAAFSWHNLIGNLLAAGDPLVDAQREAERGLEYARKARFRLVIDVITTQLALIRTLRGLTPTFGSFDDAQFDEAQLEGRLSDPRLAFAACWYWTRKLQARFFAEDYTAAVDASLKAQQLLWTSPSFVESAEAHFYGALSHAASCDAAFPDEHAQHIEALSAHHRQLVQWAENCPENFENRAALVAAEIARLEGREVDAEHLYEAAIQSARENEFVQNEALANELAARFYAGRGFETIARAYLREARSAYRRWGADGKVRQLDERYPRLSEADPRVDPTRTVETTVEQLDLAVVLQVLGAISGETDLEKLITTVMRLGLEHAGAERGLLMLPLGGAYRIEAAAWVGDDGVTVALHQAAVTAVDLPESVFQYVLRTRETVLLHDAALGGAFSTDDYLGRHRLRSLLCMPLLEQARLVGVLYLENRLASGVFTPARMALLKLIASEAAISIENARLYRDLHEREARVRRLIDANIIGIFIWHADGRVFDANDELLRIIGYSRDDLASRRLRWTDFTLPESRERDLRVLEELRQGGKLTATERELLRKDGTRVPVLTGGTMFDGVPNEGVAFVVDLTERKRAEQALRERERESLLILDTIPGLVATLTPSGEVEAINQELMTFCSQPLEAMKDWAANGIVHPDDLARMGPIFTKAIASGEPYESEARVRRFDGVYRWIQSRGLPMRDSKGRIVRWYLLLADIDDRKRAEEAIDTARSELARVARVMTMSALTASIAHEVNQPLSGIITNAGTCLRMLDASPPNIDGARETAKRTIRDGNRTSDVITRLRAMFSKREFTLESMDLNEATREVIALSLSDLQRNQVALHAELAESLPLVMGDRVQLQQVILKLLRNASEAMAEVNDRPRQLVIRAEAESNTAVRVTVRDAGVGLDPESRDKLFDAFYTTKAAWGSDSPSVARSSNDTMAVCGPSRTKARARRSRSPFPSARRRSRSALCAVWSSIH